MIIAPKLKPGDQIRVIAPSRSMAIIAQEVREIALRRLGAMGLTVTFSKHCEEIDDFNSSSTASRIQDLHEAFRDPKVQGILTAVGGFNTNQLLQYLDYDLIRDNPKVLCGLSDITALQNAITARTGLVTYSGPHISMFGMQEGFEYTQKYFEQCVMQEGKYPILPSETWSDDMWFLDQKKRTFMENPGFWSMQAGSAEGTIVGGHMRCMNSLQGTPFMPSLENTILFLEEDEEMLPHHFDRGLQSLVQLPEFAGVRGVVIGRFQKASGMTENLLRQIVASKKELAHLPILANADFSHTNPVMTFPIGGTAKITVGSGTSLTILQH